MNRIKLFGIVSVVLSFFLFTISSGAALGADQLSVIKKRGTIIVGTSADYPPFEFVDDIGNFDGFDMDLIRQIAKRLGLKVKIKDMGFDTLIAAVQRKKIDVVVAAMQGTAERDKKIDFSIPYNYVSDAFLVSKSSNIHMKTATDAKGARIGVQTGTIQENWVRDHLIKKGLMSEDQLFRYERVDSAGLDLKAGRIDIVLIQHKPAKNLVSKMGGLRIALVTNETVAAGQCIALPEGEKALKAELDRIITQLKKEGWIKQQIRKWKVD